MKMNKKNHLINLRLFNDKAIRKLPIAEALNDLISEGIMISREAKEDRVIYSKDPELAFSRLFNKYKIWRYEIGSFLQQVVVADNFIVPLVQGDELPDIKYFTEYDQADSQKSRKLVNTIRHETKSILEQLNKMKNDSKIPTGFPIFEESRGDLRFDNAVIHIADPGNYQHHICKLLFKETSKYKIGDWVTEEEIETNYGDRDFKNPKWIKDAVNKVNAKLKEKHQIEKLLEYKSARVRIIK